MFQDAAVTAVWHMEQTGFRGHKASLAFIILYIVSELYSVYVMSKGYKAGWREKSMHFGLFGCFVFSKHNHTGTVTQTCFGCLPEMNLVWNVLSACINGGIWFNLLRVSCIETLKYSWSRRVLWNMNLSVYTYTIGLLILYFAYWILWLFFQPVMQLVLSASALDIKESVELWKNTGSRVLRNSEPNKIGFVKSSESG